MFGMLCSFKDVSELPISVCKPESTLILVRSGRAVRITLLLLLSLIKSRRALVVPDVLGLFVCFVLVGLGYRSTFLDNSAIFLTYVLNNCVRHILSSISVTCLALFLLMHIFNLILFPPLDLFFNICVILDDSHFFHTFVVFFFL